MVPSAMAQPQPRLGQPDVPPENISAVYRGKENLPQSVF
jgi:hypothetical protein